MSDPNFITPEEYENWTPITRAYKDLCAAFGLHSGGKVTGEIYERLVLGQIDSASRTSVWEHRNHADQTRHYERISPQLWRDGGRVSLTDSVWTTGSCNFIVQEYGRPLATVCKGIRLNPAHLALILTDAGLPLQSTQPTEIDSGNNPQIRIINDPPVEGKNKGGAPRKPWWDDLWIEMIRRIQADTLHPTGPTDLERIMLDWLAEQEIYPGDRTLKKTAQNLYRFLQE